MTPATRPLQSRHGSSAISQTTLATSTAASGAATICSAVSCPAPTFS